MEHLVASKSVVGRGEHAIVMEIKAGSVRLKRRGMPDIYVPLDLAAEVGSFLLAAAKPTKPFLRA